MHSGATGYPLIRDEAALCVCVCVCVCVYTLDESMRNTGTKRQVCARACPLGLSSRGFRPRDLETRDYDNFSRAEIIGGWIIKAPLIHSISSNECFAPHIFLPSPLLSAAPSAYRWAYDYERYH